MNIICTLDSNITLNHRDLPKQVLDEIFSHLRIPNPQKKIAEREMLWDAESLPDYIELWKYNSRNELVLPRGFYHKLFDIFTDNDVEASCRDRTVCDSRYLNNVGSISLRDYQSKAIEELAQHRQGIYSAPTGSGKTRVMLELIRALKQKTLIICEKIDILHQWDRMAIEFGFDIGRDLFIGLRQGILATDNDKDWYNEFGCVIIDECHHACSADTLIDLVQRFPARYRFGCSATPDSDPDLFPIARAVIGPVIAHSSPDEIGEHLAIPSVKVVKTDFEFDYRPTVRVGNKVIRNNYNGMMKALEEDEDRNYIIMKEVVREGEEDNFCLIFSKRKKHLKHLYNSIDLDQFEFDTAFLTGDNSSEFGLVKNEIEIRGNRGFVLFSTLAGEGTDIPGLDRIFLTYPGRHLRGFEQAIGRVMRPHPKKKDAIVYDFRDANVSILNSQFRTRVQGIYNKKNYKVENINE